MISSSKSMDNNYYPHHGHQNYCYVKKLPTIIFSLIQSYLEEKNYLSLMKTSRSLFKDIKFETIQHVFHLNEHRIAQNYENADDKLEEMFRQFDAIRRKFDLLGRRKQLKLKIRFTPEKTILRYSSYYASIYQIHIDAIEDLSADFDFSVFNNINKVSLNIFHGITQITKGLQNIQHLILSDFKDLISIDIPLIGLDFLSFHRCPKFRSIQSLANIKSISVLRCENLILDLYSIENSLRRLYYDPCPEHLRLNRIPCQSLEILHLSGFSPSTDDNFNLLTNISELTLDNTSDHQPLFPIFHGKSLLLEVYDLSSWTTPLSSIRELSLYWCHTQAFLPIFPNVYRIELRCMDNIEEILSESLPNCVYLTISECSKIRFIHGLPKLRSIEMYDCEKFQEFIGFEKLRSNCLRKVHLTNVPVFQYSDFLKNVPDVTILSS